jgi:1-acyl-sn-glycerol-3-phosphate acyltransferase
MSTWPAAPPPTRHPMGLFLRWFAPLYATWIARRHLDGVWARDLDRLREALAKGPVILAANHVSWWDGQLLLVLHRYLGVEGRFLIKADSVDEMPYIRHLGGIPIDRRSAAGALAGLEEAAAFLTGPGRLVWIFPQGELRPPHLRPLGLERGVELLHRISKAPVLPFAWVSGWRLLHLPTWAIAVGEPISGRERFLPRLEEALVQQIDALDRWLADPSTAALEPVVPSVVVPFEDRFGAQLYTFVARMFGALRGLLSRG